MDNIIKSPPLPKRHELTFDEASLRAAIGQQNGKNNVREYHTKRYDSFHGGLIETCLRILEQIDNHVNHLKISLDKTYKHLQKTDPTLPSNDDEVRTPWNSMDRAVVLILIVGIILLLGVSVATIYTNLMATGEAIFIEKPWTAGLFSSVPLAISFALKTVIDHFKSDGSKRFAIYLIFSLGILFGLIWIGLFAYLFNGLGQSVSDVINDLVAEENSTQKLLEKVYLAVQLVTEILVAAGFWLIVKHIYDLHHQVPPRTNPVYTDLENQVKKFNEDIAKTNNKRAEAQTRLEELENQRAVYVEDALTEFDLLETQFAMKKSSMKIVPHPSSKKRGKK